MADAKIQITVGSISFSGEGTADWLEKQLDKLLKAAPELLKLEPEPAPESEDGESGAQKGNVGTLASFLVGHNAAKSQAKRFLATAEWLHRKGRPRIQTKDVAKALLDNHQKRLANPADCLNKNVAKGFCEKVGKEFFVTPEGRQTLK